MKSVLRATTPADLPGITEFLNRAFGGAAAAFGNAEVTTWKYWTPRGDWSEPRSYVLEKAGAIVAHAGLWPILVGNGETAVRGVQMIDWGAAADAPGAGLALVQKLSGMFDFIYSIGGSEMTRKVLPAFGFTEYAQTWRGASAVRPLQQILTHQSQNWKSGARLARNVLRNMRQNRGANGWTAEEIPPAETQLYDIEDAKSSPRPPAFFEYLAQCPVMDFHVFRISHTTGPRGHFALAVLHGQARLAGVWLRGAGQEAWREAYILAREAAQKLTGVNEIVAEGTEGPAGEAAAASGLRVMPGSPVYLLNKKGRLTLPADFQFQLSDDDAVFLNSGRPDYWT